LIGKNEKQFKQKQIYDALFTIRWILVRPSKEEKMTDKTGVLRTLFDVTAEVLTGLREISSQVLTERYFNAKKLGAMLGETIPTKDGLAFDGNNQLKTSTVL